MISIKKSNSLNDMIDITIRIDNRQNERYVDKKTKVRIHLIKRFFKKDSIKLNVTEIKGLRIKTYYIYEKKNHLKRNCPREAVKITKK